MPGYKNQNSMAGDTGFGLGFFCGALIGAFGVYMTVVPEGKHLKEKFISEFEAYKLKMATEPDEDSQLCINIRSIIQKVRQAINSQVSPARPKVVASLNHTDKKKHYFKAKP